MKVLIWDFDGVICASVKECYLITMAAIEKEKQRMAREAGITRFKPVSLKQFEIYRSKSVNSVDFFANYILDMHGKELTVPNLETIVKKHDAFLRFMDSVYDEQRDVLFGKDQTEYFKTLSIYPQIPKTLEKLTERGVRHSIMSARDKKSLLPIINHFNLQRHFDLVLGSEVDKGSRHVKEKQIKLLKEHYEVPSYAGEEYFFIDDFPFNLKKLEGFANLLFASWGYGKMQKDYVEAKTVENPKDLLELLK